MVNSADERRAKLTEFMKARDLKAKPWAIRAGVSPGTLFNFLAGRAASLSQRTLEKLSSAENVPIADLIGGHVNVRESPLLLRVPIIGAVQAGAWQEAFEWPKADQYEIAIPKPDVPHDGAFGLEVRGDSMNLIFPERTPLVCVRLEEFHRALKAGDKVVTTRSDGHGLLEATVKELRFDPSGQAWFWPCSNNPEHLPFAMTQRNEIKNNAVINAVVIQSIRAEV